ncbi:ExbD/TolR family protein [Variovorax terrae]|uniref:Biopolymer transporter ExbD n=1 Tax=Variovorax terrae TaxID=2923278 RepID=A0A9X2ARV5_9BURK|nr:biopolymer transporter ExbD [Variovorax terrae]MCJ0765937.1 biopolymer transporter ExbD [Variovorax terrae]
MAFGRLERSPGPQPMSDINMTPLVDVMLVLVVIFIITAPLLASSIRLDLPRSDAAQPTEAPQFVTLVVDKAGQAFLNDKPVTPAELAARLAEAASRHPDTEVQLRADQAVPYGRVVEVMGAAQKAGLNRIGFVADPAPAAAAAR